MMTWAHRYVRYKRTKPDTLQSYNKLINSKIKKGYVEIETHEGVRAGELANKDERILKNYMSNHVLTDLCL